MAGMLKFVLLDNQNKTMSNLTIYKASAGSGKTYTLVLEYLKLVFTDTQNYKYVLAVTFTNKATEEMKARILEELYGIAIGKITPMAADLLQYFEPQNLTKAQMQKTASRVLGAILHDYSRFSIYTIDRFFQQILRNFTREMGLNASYTLELDQDDRLLEVIERLLFRLERHADAKLLEWLTSYAIDLIREGKSWDFSKNLRNLSSELFKEDFRKSGLTTSRVFNDKSMLKVVYQNLSAKKNAFAEQMTTTGKAGVKMIADAGLTRDDFKYKSTSGINYFYKLAERRFEEPKQRTKELIDNPDNWPANKGSAAAVLTLYYNGLNRLLSQAVENYHQGIAEYLTANAILKNFYSLGILSDIHNELRELSAENNLLFISDTNEIIASVIRGSDAPFLYEKAGNKYNHFMIDEFQDTSRLQWKNFLPLINNSLSQGHANLIVGDVKQSIYRWRNSDWRLLAGGIHNQITVGNVITNNLDVNWRSRENIVRFNNTFFHQASYILQSYINAQFDSKADDITVINAYHEQAQKMPTGFDTKKQDGLVNFRFLSADDDESWQEQACVYAQNAVEAALNNGFKAGDIAILVRRKEEGRIVASYLLNRQNDNAHVPKYGVLSNEALSLTNSPAVRFIINILKHLNQPGNRANILEINFLWYKYLTHPKQSELPEGISERVADDIALHLKAIGGQPLYETVCSMIKLYNLGQIVTESVYLETLLEKVKEYTMNRPSDLYSFLNYWEKNGHKLSVVLPGESDAVNVLTIHKSKGLQFPVVIVPFVAWPFDNVRNAPMLWVNAPKDIAPILPIVPVQYNKALANTEFATDFHNEFLYSGVDNLNLMYVAFTRAIDALYCCGPISKSGMSASRIANQIFTAEIVSESDLHFANLSTYYSPDTQILQIGSLPVLTKNSTEPNELNATTISVNNNIPKLRIKYNHRNKFEPGENAHTIKLSHGRNIHSILEQVDSWFQLPLTAQKMHNSGHIDPDELALIMKLHDHYSYDPMVQNWFNQNKKQLKEQPMLLQNGSEMRPDKLIIEGKHAIIVDYKTGIERKKDEQQVLEYARVLKLMGFEKIEGYLWYLEEFAIKSVI